MLLAVDRERRERGRNADPPDTVGGDTPMGSSAAQKMVARLSRLAGPPVPTLAVKVPFGAIGTGGLAIVGFVHQPEPSIWM